MRYYLKDTLFHIASYLNWFIPKNNTLVCEKHPNDTAYKMDELSCVKNGEMLKYL